jgi:hypothetical protein
MKTVIVPLLNLLFFYPTLTFSICHSQFNIGENIHIKRMPKSSHPDLVAGYGCSTRNSGHKNFPQGLCVHGPLGNWQIDQINGDEFIVESTNPFNWATSTQDIYTPSKAAENYLKGNEKNNPQVAKKTIEDLYRNANTATLTKLLSVGYTRLISKEWLKFIQANQRLIRTNNKCSGAVVITFNCLWSADGHTKNSGEHDDQAEWQERYSLAQNGVSIKGQTYRFYSESLADSLYCVGENEQPVNLMNRPPNLCGTTLICEH